MIVSCLIPSYKSKLSIIQNKLSTVILKCSALNDLFDLSPGSTEQDYSSVFHDNEFYECVAQQINKYASYCQKDRPDSK